MMMGGISAFLPTQNWVKINGKDPHAVLPFAGNRASLVAFTHRAAFANGRRDIRVAAKQDGFPFPMEQPAELTHADG